MSIFADESGIFQYPDDLSRFYILTLVLHDQDLNVAHQIKQFERNIAELGLVNHDFVFHAGPIIRKEDGFSLMNRELRGKIFNRMMTFARHVDFKYHCICIDKKFVTSSEHIIERMRHNLDEFIATSSNLLSDYGRIKIYYDCGQTTITNLLHESFSGLRSPSVEFAQNVKPANYKLFQIADLVCTIKLMEMKIASNEHFTKSEDKFFGGERSFKRNIMRKLASKELKRKR